MIRLVFLALFVAFTLSSNAQGIDKDTIKQDINNMSISNDYNFEILSISKIINNICIVTITPPYREFPNILIYNYNNTKQWNRVFESLCIGIQPEPSNLLDLHTINYGVDFMVGNDTLFKLNQDIKRVINEASNNSSIVIPYQNFLHMHSSPSIQSFYTIDKTSYFDFANIPDFAHKTPHKNTKGFINRWLVKTNLKTKLVVPNFI